MKIVDITIKICNELTLNMYRMLKKSKNSGKLLFQHPVNKIDKQTGGDNRDFLTTKTGGE